MRNTTSLRKQLQFDAADPSASEVSRLLDKFGRKQSKIVVWAVSEFAQKYGLDRMSDKDISGFPAFYPYISSARLHEYPPAQPMPVPVQAQTSSVAHAAPAASSPPAQAESVARTESQSAHPLNTPEVSRSAKQSMDDLLHV